MNWREHFPLETGDQIQIDGRTLELVDLPTDGPQFEDLDEEDPAFKTVQMTVEEFDEATEECEFCGELVRKPAHVVANGRIFMDDETTCAECGYSDDELLEWVEEYQPGSLGIVKSRLDE